MRFLSWWLCHNRTRGWAATSITVWACVTFGGFGVGILTLGRRR